MKKNDGLLGYAVLMLGLGFAAVAVGAIHLREHLYEYNGQEYQTSAECVDAMLRGLGPESRECVKRITVQGDCSDVAAPADFVPNLTGYQCPSSAVWWFEETRQVRRNDTFPACWAVEAVPISSCQPAPEALEIDPDGPWLPEIPEGKDPEIEAPHRGLEP
jgi:hypothetical protein